MAALVFAAYLLISQLADIGFGTIADELRDADPAWVLVALILAQLTFIGSGISVRGAVADAAPPAAMRRAAVGDQVHQPDRPELGGSHRHEPALPPADGGSDRTGARRGRRRRRRRRRSSRWRSSSSPLSFVDVQLDTSEFSGAGPDQRLLIGIGVALLV